MSNAAVLSRAGNRAVLAVGSAVVDTPRPWSPGQVGLEALGPRWVPVEAASEVASEVGLAIEGTEAAGLDAVAGLAAVEVLATATAEGLEVEAVEHPH